MNVTNILSDILNIILIITHLLQTFSCLLQLKYVLAELGIRSVKVVIVDVIAGSLKLVSLSAEYDADSGCLKLVLPLHLHEEVVRFLFRLIKLQ